MTWKEVRSSKQLNHTNDIIYVMITEHCIPQKYFDTEYTESSTHIFNLGNVYILKNKRFLLTNVFIYLLTVNPLVWFVL